MFFCFSSSRAIYPAGVQLLARKPAARNAQSKKVTKVRRKGQTKQKKILSEIYSPNKNHKRDDISQNFKKVSILDLPKNTTVERQWKSTCYEEKRVYNSTVTDELKAISIPVISNPFLRSVATWAVLSTVSASCHGGPSSWHWNREGFQKNIGPLLKDENMHIFSNIRVVVQIKDSKRLFGMLNMYV